MDSINIVRSVQSGAGAISLHKVANQSFDFNQISTAPSLVSNVKVDGTYRRYFGNVVRQKNTEFDFPRGAPGVYAQSQPGTSGLGNLAEGAYNSGGHDSVFKPAADLLEAQGIVNREVHMDTHFTRPEHYHYEDRTRETLQEQMVNMAEDFQREKIKDYLAKGFTEEEITKKLEREREKAIDKAEKMPYDSRALMAAQIAKQVPVELREDFPNKANPGGIPTPRDTSAFQRAMNAPSLVSRQKKYQAMNREMKISGQVSKVEPPVVDLRHEEQQTHSEIVSRIAREHASERQKVQELSERAVEQQKMIEQEEEQKEEAMAKAMGPGYNLRPRKVRAEPKPAPEGMTKITPLGGKGRPRLVEGQVVSIEDVQRLATREQMPLSAFMQLPGLMKQSVSAGLEGMEKEHLESKMKKGMF